MKNQPHWCCSNCNTRKTSSLLRYIARPFSYPKCRSTLKCAKSNTNYILSIRQAIAFGIANLFLTVGYYALYFHRTEVFSALHIQNMGKNISAILFLPVYFLAAHLFKALVKQYLPWEAIHAKNESLLEWKCYEAKRTEQKRFAWSFLITHVIGYILSALICSMC